VNTARVVDAIRKKFQNGSAILLYHRVAELDRDPQLLAVSPANFAEHLQILRRKTNVVALRDMVRNLDSDSSPRSVALTFDDGYADNLIYAKPLLERYETPATVFVVSGHVGTDREFWWDDLDRLLLRSEDSGWSVEERTESEPRHVEYRSTHAKLRASHPKRRDEMLGELQKRVNGGARSRTGYRALSREELVQLADGGLVEIGAHTVTHPVLARLDCAEQTQEIEQSKKDLQEWLGQPIHSFAYPYGGKSDYDGNSVGSVRQAGFRMACSNFPGMVWRSTNRFELPRFLVRNWNGETFERIVDTIFQ
jgi:peptidoglycan/xylan/chitin deacetylase (PgdA/CDA1 family)